MVETLYKREKRVPDRTVKCYLTVDCNLNCHYCSADVPNISRQRKDVILPPEVWAEGINRRNRACLLAGGEVFLYPHFAELVNLIKRRLRIDIVTNGSVDMSDWLLRVHKKPRFLISCHPMSDKQREQWKRNVLHLVYFGFGVRFHVIKSEGWRERVEFIRSLGIPHRITACDDQRSYIKSRIENRRDKVHCTGRLFIYGPDGYRYPCARLMGLGQNGLEHISEPDDADWLTVENCSWFGQCTGCDNMIEGEVTCE